MEYKIKVKDIDKVFKVDANNPEHAVHLFNQDHLIVNASLKRFPAGVEEIKKSQRPIAGCVINEVTAKVIGETLRNETSLKGDEIMKFSRTMEEKCKTKRYYF